MLYSFNTCFVLFKKIDYYCVSMPKVFDSENLVK